MEIPGGDCRNLSWLRTQKQETKNRCSFFKEHHKYGQVLWVIQSPEKDDDELLSEMEEKENVLEPLVGYLFKKKVADFTAGSFLSCWTGFMCLI